LPIINVLTAYVRENVPRKSQRCAGHPAGIKHQFPSDIQAIISYLGQRDRRYEPSNTVIYLDEDNLSPGANLKNAEFSLAYLSRSDLSNADMRGAHFNGAYFTFSCLANADLRGADLREAHFGDANLSGADLRWDPNLKRATNLSGAVSLSQSQIDRAHGDTTTILPRNLHIPTAWTSK
jgi:hypothetical protein